MVCSFVFVVICLMSPGNLTFCPKKVNVTRFSIYLLLYSLTNKASSPKTTCLHAIAYINYTYEPINHLTWISEGGEVCLYL